jgi:hypothetical protein
MARTRVVASCAALLTILGATSATRRAHAQTTLTERLRVQGIYSTQTGTVPPTDIAAQAVPELSLLDVSKRSQVRATYTFAITAHSTLPADISNRLVVTSAFDLSKRTSFLLGAEAGHTTVTNSLILRNPANAPTSAVPIGIGQIFTSRLSEGVSWEASSRMRFTQLADATYISTIDAPPNLSVEAYLANLVLSLDRVWPTDAIGVDLRGGYAESHVAPLPRSRLVPIGLTPHWRHDISRTLTSLVVGGGTVVLSPDPDTKRLVAPFGQGTLSYLLDDSTFDLTASIGTTANALTAQLLNAEQATFRTTTTLSNAHHVVASAGVGYTHGTVIELRRNIVPQPPFDAFIADAGVSWSPTLAVDLFTRYQFVDQITASGVGLTATPALQRHAVIIGIQISARPDPVRVPTRFPQRVDRGDASVGTSSGTTPNPSSGGGSGGSDSSGAPSSSGGGGGGGGDSP